MRGLAARFVRDRTGATAIEYALIAALVGAGIFTALSGFGGSLRGLMTSIADKMSAAPKA